jgi:hypothetical protein
MIRKFINPTTKDMAEYFESLPPYTPFRLSDPYNGWIIPEFSIQISRKIPDLDTLMDIEIAWLPIRGEVE